MTDTAPDNALIPELHSVDQVRSLLGRSGSGVQLHEAVARETRHVVSLLSEPRFSVTTDCNATDFASRIDGFETVVKPLCQIQSVLATWALPADRTALLLPLKRVAETNQGRNGTVVWLRARWFPSLLLLYAGGIAAVAEERYDNLSRLFSALGPSEASGHNEMEPLVSVIVREMSDVVANFRSLQGMEQRRLPLNDHVHGWLLPVLDEVLFLGSDYESAFDRFEILLGIHHAYLSQLRGRNAWGPIGRFSWKSTGAGLSLYNVVGAEAAEAKDTWPPIAAGMFGGSSDAFLKIHSEFGRIISQRQQW